MRILLLTFICFVNTIYAQSNVSNNAFKLKGDIQYVIEYRYDSNYKKDEKGFYEKDTTWYKIEKYYFTEEVYLQMIEIAKVEYLIKKAAFENSILELSKEIKTGWWKENKGQIVKRIGK